MKQIIRDSSHMFINCNIDTRNSLIEYLQTNYPVVNNTSKPMSILIQDIVLNNNDTYNKQDLLLLKSITREYLSFQILYNILTNIESNLDIEYLNGRIINLVKSIDIMYRGDGFDRISDFNELLYLLNIAIDFYKDYYNDLINNGYTEMDIDTLKIPFIDLLEVVKMIKQMICNSSYFGIFIENNNIPKLLKQEINSLINSRINKDISMKILCPNDNWGIYYDNNGEIIQNIHDYKVLQLK